MSKDDVSSVLAADKDSKPTTLKVGDKEYTPEDIAKLEEERSKIQKDFENLHVDYTKKAAKLSKFEQASLDKADEVISGDTPASDLTAQEIADLKYLNRMGFLTDKKLDKIMEDRDADIDRRIEEKLAKRDESERDKIRKTQLEKEINGLTSQYPFVDEAELKKFMAEQADQYNQSNRSEGAIYANATQAAKVLYFDQFVAHKVNPKELPTVEGTKKSQTETPKPKIIDWDDSRAVNEHIKESLFGSRE